MNRLINFKQNQANPTTRFEHPILNIRFFDDSREILAISPRYINSGESLLIVPFQTPDGQIVPVNFSNSNYIVDISRTDLILPFEAGGRIDGLTLTEDSVYNIFAFADDNFDPIGFALYKIPYCQFITTGATAGSTITLTSLDIDANYFTVGSRIAIKPTIITEWNEATIISIDSSTQITAQTENITTSTNISAQAVLGGQIIQLNNFTPYIPKTQTTYFPYYTLIGQLITSEDVTPIIYSYNVKDGNQSDVNFIGPVFLKRVIQGTWGPRSLPNNVWGAVYNTSGNNLDAVEHNFYLSSGVYEFYTFNSTDRWGGIQRVMIDQELVDQVDLYSNPGTANYYRLATNFEVRHSGFKRMRIMCNGQNASSLGYDVYFHGAELKRIS